MNTNTRKGLLKFGYLVYHTGTFISNVQQPHRKDTPFLRQQVIWIISNYGEWKNVTELSITIRLQVVVPRHVPGSKVFLRVINNHMAYGDVTPQKLPCASSYEND